jgi:outer membrane lipase/esterase
VRSAEARERGERARDEGEATPVADARIDIGPFALIANARGTWFERERDPTTDLERGTEGDTRGVELGFDRRMSDRVFLGALLAAEKTEFDYSAELPGVNFTPAERAGDAETDAYSFTGYLTVNLGERGFLEGSVGYVRQDHTFRRNSVFQESTRTVAQTNVDTEGETDGEVVWAGLNLGYDWNSGASTFGPYGGITYARSKIDAYAEDDLTGSGLAMGFAETDRTSLQGHFGLRFDRAISTGSGVFVPQVRVEYLHEFDDDAPQATASFVLDAAASQFTFLGDEPESGVVNAGVGATWILPGGWIWFVNVDYLASGDIDRTRATLGLRAEF